MSLLCLLPIILVAQEPPYDVYPEAEPPYHRIRYEGSQKEGELRFSVKYTVWIPAGIETLSGVVVHQHGCGEGSCKSGLTGAFDLHWQALAQKHECALLSPSYEQPGDANCGLWCDPRNGSGDKFQQALVDLGTMSGHTELATVPWALWGHSGGAMWSGSMTLLYPDRIVAAWLRSGMAPLEPIEGRPERKVFDWDPAIAGVPIMCNLGTGEGYTDKEGKFSGVWPAVEPFHRKIRSEGGLIAVSIDPLTDHECGNQRYLAIPWLDACLSARLPEKAGDPLNPMPTEGSWLATLEDLTIAPAAVFNGKLTETSWLPNQNLAEKWAVYMKDTNIPDTTPPPAPDKPTVGGNVLTWTAVADLESGIERFLIERDGEVIASVPEKPKNRFGRPLFQGLQYSDTPEQPLVQMTFTDETAEADKDHLYRVITVNTAGLQSE
ncbi:MAG: hypothetical protein AAF357_12645 [Verrucomicrobiota bacterium]